MHDICTNLIFASNAGDIILTMCDGEVLYKNGEFKTIDIEKTIFESNKCVKEILQK
ncbi:MAG: hypothetical protein MJ189_04430 [Coriobacteriales bacterium]|nr:hypothetical protein [Coriobacteriales bacterium]